MTYVVAELGQCHQGAPEIARDMIFRAAHPVDPERDLAPVPYAADAVKTVKRDLDGGELSRAQRNRDYTDPSVSFAHDTGTYAEHRRRLELPWSVHHDLCDYAHGQGLDFVMTLCAPSLVAEMPTAIDYLKVASRDIDHIPLLREMAKSKVPMILSTGMADRPKLDRALEAIESANGTVAAILHCTSTYPCPFEDAHLGTIRWLRDQYPNQRVGFSDHTQGVQAGAWAVMLGAQVVEAHMTPSRVMRGGDHPVALSMAHGWWRYVRNIRHAEEALGGYRMVVPDSVEAAREKLGRSLAFASDLPEGAVVGSSDLVLVSPDDGLDWDERDRIVGGELEHPVEANVLVSSTMVG